MSDAESNEKHPESDVIDSRTHREYLQDRSDYLGIKRYSYTEAEYTQLRKLAKQLNFSDLFLGNFQTVYKNIHAVDIQGMFRRKTFNAFIGIFHDGSLRQYYRYATSIERTARDFSLPTVSKTSDCLDDLSGIRESRYGKIWVID